MPHNQDAVFHDILGRVAGEIERLGILADARVVDDVFEVAQAVPVEVNDAVAVYDQYDAGLRGIANNVVPNNPIWRDIMDSHEVDESVVLCPVFYRLPTSTWAWWFRRVGWCLDIHWGVPDLVFTRVAGFLDWGGAIDLNQRDTELWTMRIMPLHYNSWMTSDQVNLMLYAGYTHWSFVKVDIDAFNFLARRFSGSSPFEDAMSTFHNYLTQSYYSDEDRQDRWHMAEATARAFYFMCLRDHVVKMMSQPSFVVSLRPPRL